MRAYLEFSRKSFQEQIAYRGALLLRIPGYFVCFYLLKMFWEGLYANNPSGTVGGISLKPMLTYALISAIVGGLYQFPGILQVYLNDLHVLPNKM